MPQNLRNLVLPSAWDTAELTRLTLADGTTYEDMVTDIEAALTIASDNLLASYSGRLVSLAEDIALEYDSGDTNGFQPMTERGQGDTQKSDGSGHMLPLIGFDYPMNWTYLWLESARRADIDRQINGLVKNTKNIFEKQVYGRLFKMEEETGNRYGLGTTGVSVPFCDGGNGAIAYTPVSNPERGGTFAATHTHFLRLNGINQANIEAGVNHLWEHGADGPYELIVSLADVSSWTDVSAITGFVERPDPDVLYGANASLANVEDMYIGGVKTKRGFCRLYANGRIPTRYWAVTKAYGPEDMMNPLSVRTKNGTLGASLVVNTVANFPLQGATPMIFFGVGVGMQREAAVLVRNDTSGNYTSPVIS